RPLLGHDKQVTVRAERDLRWIGARTDERPRRVWQRFQHTATIQREAGNVLAARVEDVDEASVHGDADWFAASRRRLAPQLETMSPHFEHGKIVAPCIDDYEPALVLSQRQPTLIPKPSTSARPARRHAAGGPQAPVERPIEDHDLIA